MRFALRFRRSCGGVNDHLLCFDRPPYMIGLLELGRACSQSCCPTNTDRDPATEIADRVGRSVGAQASPAPVFTPQRRQFQRAADADFEGNPMKSSHFMPFFAQKSPAARLDATSSMACLQQATVAGELIGALGRLQPHM